MPASPIPTACMLSRFDRFDARLRIFDADAMGGIRPGQLRALQENVRRRFSRNAAGVHDRMEMFVQAERFQNKRRVFAGRRDHRRDAAFPEFEQQLLNARVRILGGQARQQRDVLLVFFLGKALLFFLGIILLPSPVNQDSLKRLHPFDALERLVKIPVDVDADPPGQVPPSREVVFCGIGHNPVQIK